MRSPLTPTRPATLVVGYGSDLRGDDAAGRRAAEALAERALAGVEVRSATQLTPELADELGGRRVVFVDATVSEHTVVVRELDAAPPAGPVSHHVDPGGLLELAALLGTSPRAAWLVHIPATDLGLGTELSPTTQQAVREAVDRVAELCADSA